MGLLSKLAATAIVGAVGVTAAVADNKLTERFGESDVKAGIGFRSYQEKMLSQSSFCYHLWMKEENDYVGDGFSKATYMFFDIDGNMKYIAEGRSDKKRQRISLYDSFDNKVGEISENLFAFRNPLFKEDHPINFDITVHGNELGQLKSAHGVWKDKLVLDFKKWTLQNKSLGKYHVFNSFNNELAVYSTKLLSRVTFIEYNDATDEILILLLAMAVRAQEKSEERKRK